MYLRILCILSVWKDSHVVPIEYPLFGSEYCLYTVLFSVFLTSSICGNIYIAKTWTDITGSALLKVSQETKCSLLIIYSKICYCLCIVWFWFTNVWPMLETCVSESQSEEKESDVNHNSLRKGFVLMFIIRFHLCEQ